MITVRARLARANSLVGADGGAFHVMELKTAEGDDLSELVREDDLFRTIEELDAFLTLRLARETRAEIAD